MPEQPDTSSAWQGAGLAFVATIAWCAFLAFLAFLLSAMPGQAIAGLLMWAFFGIGLAQLVYLIPLGLWLKNRGKHNAVRGVVIFGSVIFLLNASCFGLIFRH